MEKKYVIFFRKIYIIFFGISGFFKNVVKITKKTLYI